MKTNSSTPYTYTVPKNSSSEHKTTASTAHNAEKFVIPCRLAYFPWIFLFYVKLLLQMHKNTVNSVEITEITEIYSHAFLAKMSWKQRID